MELEKIWIFVEKSSKPLEFDEHKPIKALFNPNQIAIVKAANWESQPIIQRDVPALQFTHGNSETLTVDLFFDTFESKVDVRKNHTDHIAKLATVQSNLHRPPICKLMWGVGLLFQGVLQNLNQRFTLFLADGTPVRAILTCTFIQRLSDEEQERLQKKSSADVAKTYTVKRGDTLSSIASEHYGDPALWRPIAEANRIDDARTIQPGSILAIPSLPSRSGVRR